MLPGAARARHIALGVTIGARVGCCERQQYSSAWPLVTVGIANRGVTLSGSALYSSTSLPAELTATAPMPAQSDRTATRGRHQLWRLGLPYHPHVLAGRRARVRSRAFTLRARAIRRFALSTYMVTVTASGIGTLVPAAQISSTVWIPSSRTTLLPTTSRYVPSPEWRWRQPRRRGVSALAGMLESFPQLSRRANATHTHVSPGGRATAAAITFRRKVQASG